MAGVAEDQPLGAADVDARPLLLRPVLEDGGDGEDAVARAAEADAQIGAGGHDLRPQPVGAAVGGVAGRQVQLPQGQVGLVLDGDLAVRRRLLLRGGGPAGEQAGCQRRGGEPARREGPKRRHAASIPPDVSGPWPV
jgi:hypothetical protein